MGTKTRLGQDSVSSLLYELQLQVMMQLAALYSYRVQLKNGKLRIIKYNDIIQQLTASDEEDADSWEYDGIISHQWGKDIRKGKIDLHVKWKGYDEPTWEPLKVIKQDDPMTVAKYALENKLTDKLIWRWTRKYVKNPKIME